MPELFFSPVFVRSYLIAAGEDAMEREQQATSELLDEGSEQFNVTVVEEVDYRDPLLDPLTSDLWIGVVLILMILSCVGCVCSCLLYHKFQQWKQHERRGRLGDGGECGRRASSESLPSYTLVTGLPSYAEAMEAQSKMSQLSAGGLVYLYPPPPPFTEVCGAPPASQAPSTQTEPLPTTEVKS